MSILIDSIGPFGLGAVLCFAVVALLAMVPEKKRAKASELTPWLQSIIKDPK